MIEAALPGVQKILTIKFKPFTIKNKLINSVLEEYTLAYPTAMYALLLYDIQWVIILL